KFVPDRIFEAFPQTQPQLDTLLQRVKEQHFYDGQIINEKTSATLLAITVNPAFLNSLRWVEVIATKTATSSLMGKRLPGEQSYYDYN
ncbi:hypothetical protein, partial [Pontibacter qinzhouensis]|uniref:hypothetical protein n=1 Tax=Pontibacter qinzhouensis TaxID=2603253 RepID=UPI00164F4D08